MTSDLLGLAIWALWALLIVAVLAVNIKHPLGILKRVRSYWRDRKIPRCRACRQAVDIGATNSIRLCQSCALWAATNHTQEAGWAAVRSGSGPCELCGQPAEFSELEMSSYHGWPNRAVHKHCARAEYGRAELAHKRKTIRSNIMKSIGTVCALAVPVGLYIYDDSRNAHETTRPLDNGELAWQRSAAQTVFAVQNQEDTVIDAVGEWRLASIDACQELAFDSPCAMKLPERATVVAKVRAMKASIQMDFKLLSRTAPSSEAKGLAERAAADSLRKADELPNFLSPTSSYQRLSTAERESSSALVRWGR